jgi:hypothetical protein
LEKLSGNVKKDHINCVGEGHGNIGLRKPFEVTEEHASWLLISCLSLFILFGFLALFQQKTISDGQVNLVMQLSATKQVVIENGGNTETSKRVNSLVQDLETFAEKSAKDTVLYFSFYILYLGLTAFAWMATKVIIAIKENSKQQDNAQLDRGSNRRLKK